MNDDRPERLPYQMPEDDTDRSHGQHILAIVEEDAKRRQGADPLLEALRKAHRAKASEAEADQQ